MRARPTLATGLIVSMGALVASCSAFGLGDYELLACDPDDADACAIVNDQLPPDVCPRYRCHPAGGCAPEEITEERCDGRDNDCDRAIDEGTQPEGGDAYEAFVPIDGDVTRISHTALPTGVAHVAVTYEPERAQPMQPRFPITRLTLTGDGEPAKEPLSLGECMSNARTACTVDDLVLAATPKVLVGAGFQRQPCGSGQLRIAAGTPAPFELELGDDAIRAGTAIAVDVDESSAQRCSVSALCKGGLAPQVALLPATQEAPADALVVWQSESAADPKSCGTSADFQIAAIGVTIEATEPPRISTPTPARSVPLGGASGPAAVVALRGDTTSSGYVVAFPSGDHVRLLFVERPASEAHVKSGLAASIEAPAASEVALTAPPEGVHGLALAYRTVIDGSPRVQMAVLSVDLEAERITSAPAITVETKGELLEGLSVVYAPAGFATPNAGWPTGGWIVTWIERSTDAVPPRGRLMASRIAEVKLEDDAGAPVQLATDAHKVFTYLKQDEAGASLLAGFMKGDALHFKGLSREP